MIAGGEEHPVPRPVHVHATAAPSDGAMHGIGPERLEPRVPALVRARLFRRPPRERHLRPDRDLTPAPLDALEEIPIEVTRRERVPRRGGELVDHDRLRLRLRARLEPPRRLLGARERGREVVDDLHARESLRRAAPLLFVVTELLGIRGHVLDAAQVAAHDDVLARGEPPPRPLQHPGLVVGHDRDDHARRPEPAHDLVLRDEPRAFEPRREHFGIPAPARGKVAEVDDARPRRHSYITYSGTGTSLKTSLGVISLLLFAVSSSKNSLKPAWVVDGMSLTR